MIIFDYFITEYICLNGLFITFIIFNDSISKDIFFDAFPITAIVFITIEQPKLIRNIRV